MYIHVYLLSNFLEVTCPKLAVPANGKHLDTACNGANSQCKATCSMECNTGYVIQGSPLLTCLGTGKWDNSQGTCKGTKNI